MYPRQLTAPEADTWKSVGSHWNLGEISHLRHLAYPLRSGRLARYSSSVMTSTEDWVESVVSCFFRTKEPPMRRQ